MFFKQKSRHKYYLLKVYNIFGMAVSFTKILEIPTTLKKIVVVNCVFIAI